MFLTCLQIYLQIILFYIQNILPLSNNYWTTIIPLTDSQGSGPYWLHVPTFESVTSGVSVVLGRDLLFPNNIFPTFRDRLVVSSIMLEIYSISRALSPHHQILCILFKMKAPYKFIETHYCYLF